jgi:hypothetical protein
MLSTSSALIFVLACIFLSVLSFALWVEPQLYSVEVRQQLLEFAGIAPLAHDLQLLLSVALLWRGMTALLWWRGRALWAI